MAEGGQKIPSRNETHERDVTRSGNSLTVESGDTTDGEGFGPGVRHSATLRERTNKSLNRNSGPTRPSANSGSLPVPSQSVRKTGRV